MEKYKILKDFSTFEHQYKCGEIYYVDKKIGMDYGMALIYIDNQENSKNIDRINQRYYYCLQYIEDICEQSKMLEIGKIYHYKDLCVILNEMNMGYNYTSKKRISQQEKWKKYFEWVHTNKRFMYKITKIYDNSESLLEKNNNFIKDTEYLKNVAGVYILKFKDELPYIGQSTDLQERLATHRDKYGDFEFEILEKITNNNIYSKYILSTALIYLEGKYIDNYGLENLQNRVNSYKDCCNISTDINIYGFMKDTDKEVTYNLFKKLELLNNNIDLFLEECKTYTIPVIKNLPYYKNDIKIENFKSILSQLYDINLSDCHQWYEEIDRILIEFFKERIKNNE